MKRWDLLEVQREVRGEDGLLQQLHHAAVLAGAEVRKDVVTLRTEKKTG